MAKVNPAQFLHEVRTESAKIVWPTRKETVTTGVMVLIMTSILAVFFFAVDAVFHALVKLLLSFIA